MPSINTNVAAIKARSSLDKVQRELNTSIARLSSGKRITRAHDDAARRGGRCRARCHAPRRALAQGRPQRAGGRLPLLPAGRPVRAGGDGGGRGGFGARGARPRNARGGGGGGWSNSGKGVTSHGFIGGAVRARTSSDVSEDGRESRKRAPYRAVATEQFLRWYFQRGWARPLTARLCLSFKRCAGRRRVSVLHWWMFSNIFLPGDSV